MGDPNPRIGPDPFVNQPIPPELLQQLENNATPREVRFANRNLRRHLPAPARNPRQRNPENQEPLVAEGLHLAPDIVVRAPTPPLVPHPQVLRFPEAEMEAEADNRLLVPFFSGQPGEDFVRWLTRFDQFAATKAWTPEQKLLHLPTRLRGSAEIIYNQLRDDQRDSYDHVKDALRREFVNPDSADFNYNQLTHRSQKPGESVASYYCALLSLCQLAFPNDPVENHHEEMRRIFMQGLQPSLRQAVKRARPTTFQTAVSEAKAAETIDILDPEAVPSTSDPQLRRMATCLDQLTDRILTLSVAAHPNPTAAVTYTTPANDGLQETLRELKSDMAQLKQTVSSQYSRPTSSRDFQSGPRRQVPNRNGNSRGQPICNRCQRPGHSSFNCPKGQWCEYHQRFGHHTRDCRDKPSQHLSQRNNSSNFNDGYRSRDAHPGNRNLQGSAPRSFPPNQYQHPGKLSALVAQQSPDLSYPEYDLNEQEMCEMLHDALHFREKTGQSFLVLSTGEMASPDANVDILDCHTDGMSPLPPACLDDNTSEMLDYYKEQHRKDQKIIQQLAKEVEFKDSKVQQVRNQRDEASQNHQQARKRNQELSHKCQNWEERAAHLEFDRNRLRNEQQKIIKQETDAIWQRWQQAEEENQFMRKELSRINPQMVEKSPETNPVRILPLLDPVAKQTTLFPVSPATECAVSEPKVTRPETPPPPSPVRNNADLRGKISKNKKRPQSLLTLDVPRPRGFPNLKHPKLHFALTAALAFCFFATASAQPLLCQTTAGKTIFQLPAPVPCDNKVKYTKGVATSEAVQLYKRNHIQYRTEAWVCKTIKTVVRSFTYFFDDEHIRHVEKVPVPTSAEECHRMAKWHRSTYGDLRQRGDLWEMNPIGNIPGASSIVVTGKNPSSSTLTSTRQIDDRSRSGTPRLLQAFSTCDRYRPSNIGLGAVLSQEQANGTIHPIAYVSRLLNRAEKNYSTSEKEALAIVWGCKQFRPYIFQKPLRITTDHKPLVWLKSVQDKSDRLRRWSVILSQYFPEIFHKPGKLNSNADALSRSPLPNPPELVVSPPTPVPQEEDFDEEIFPLACTLNRTLTAGKIMVVLPPLSPPDLKKLQREDPHFGPIIESLENLPGSDTDGSTRLSQLEKDFCLVDGVLYRIPDKRKSINLQFGLQRCIPGVLQQEFLEACHDDLCGGHLGFDKTLSKVSSRYFWPNLTDSVKQHCEKCHLCATRKGAKTQPHAPLTPTPVGGPFERVAVDVVGPIHQSLDGNRFIIVFTDYLTKWPEAAAVPDTRAETIAKVFMQEIVCRHGAPVELLSDKAANFLSELVQAVCQLCNTRKLNTTGYSPQTNGAVENLNKTLVNILSMYTNTRQDDWDRYLPFALFAYRTSVQRSTGYTPAELLYGRDLRMPIDAAFQQPPNPNLVWDENYARLIQRYLTQARAAAKENIEAAQQRQKTQYDKRVKAHHYEIGEQVYLYTPVHKRGYTHKLFHEFHGPYVVTGVHLPRIQLQSVDHPGQKPFWVHSTRIKKSHLEMIELGAQDTKSQRDDSTAGPTISASNPAEPQPVPRYNLRRNPNPTQRFQPVSFAGGASSLVQQTSASIPLCRGSRFQWCGYHQRYGHVTQHCRAFNSSTRPP